VRAIVCVIAVTLAACGSGPSTVVDASTATDAVPGIACLTAGICPPPQVCCHRTGTTPACQSPAQQCVGQASLCDGPEDCGGAGAVCCEHPSGAADCAGIVACDGRTRCHDDAECGAGALCCDPAGPSRENGYRYCTAGGTCPR
jgi:hypothetical protein